MGLLSRAKTVNWLLDLIAFARKKIVYLKKGEAAPAEGWFIDVAIFDLLKKGEGN